jgi:hypothetical protein
VSPVARRPICIVTRPGFFNGSADDKLNDPPHVLAPLKPDSNGTGTHVIYHHGAGFIDSLGYLTDPYRAHR